MVFTCSDRIHVRTFVLLLVHGPSVQVNYSRAGEPNPGFSGRKMKVWLVAGNDCGVAETRVAGLNSNAWLVSGHDHDQCKRSGIGYVTGWGGLRGC